MNLEDLGEAAFIKSLSRKFKLDKSVKLGIGDDAAVIRWTGDRYMLFACDMLIEDCHFKLKEAPPFQIGWKALGVNLSDIAAMGGVPRYAVIAIGVNPRMSAAFIDGVYKGIKALAEKFSVNIVGGDTNDSKKFIIDTAVIGAVEKENLATRSGAKPGDAILLTGAVGGSIKGRHLNFTPRIKESRYLARNFKINSMIDVSDGLLLDLGRISEASGSGAVIYENRIPLSPDAASFETAIRDGEDFELLFTMSPLEARRLFKKGSSPFGTAISLIGEVTDKKGGISVVYENGRMRNLKPEGYTHF